MTTAATALIRHRAAVDAALAERLDAQCRYAERLGELRPNQAATLSSAASAARARFATELAAGRSVAAALASAETLLQPISAVCKSITIHCVGHAHIDMNWMWAWPETVACTLDSFRTVLRLMDEFPDFTFSQSQASVYRIVEQHDPQLLDAIRARIREGRWEVVASHWVEGERNVAGGEALCRHLIETRGYLRELLGLQPEDVIIDWSPDTFGHAATLPMIDSAGGVQVMYSCRTGRTDRPAIFRWRAPDGSQLLVLRETVWYNNQVTAAYAGNAVDFCKATGLDDFMAVYGVGDHGGGPTRRDLRTMIDLDTWPAFPRFRFGKAQEYAKLVLKQAERFPLIEGELNFEFAGCYTAQSRIKRGNRTGEALCAEADTAGMLARSVAGRAPGRAAVKQAWRDVLFGHFHDILPGSGVRGTREWQMALLQGVQATCGQERSIALRAIAARIDTRFGATAEPAPPAALTSTAIGGGAGRLRGELTTACHAGDGPRPAVIFNPVAWARDEVTTITLWDGDDGTHEKPLRERTFRLRRSDGSTVAAQVLNTAQAIWPNNSSGYWGHDYVDLAVPVAVGGLGWQAVAIEEGQGTAPSETVELLHERDGGHGHRANRPEVAIILRNRHLELVIDKTLGAPSHLIDRASGCDVAGGALARLQVVRERPHIMSAWEVGDEDGAPQPVTIDRIEPGSPGPHLVSVKVSARWRESRFTIEYRLSAGARNVEVLVEGTWFERGTPETGTPRLEMGFDLALEATVLRAEVPFGAVTRPDTVGRVVPALRWLAVDGNLQGKPASLVVATQGQHGHSLAGRQLRVHLLRASYEPDPLPEIGEHSMRLSFAPVIDVPDNAAATRLASALEHPLQVVGTDRHPGTVSATVIGARVEPASVLLTQVKPAESGSGIVLRLSNPGPTSVDAVVTLDPSVVGTFSHATRCDILERAQAGAACTWAGGVLRLSLAPFALATVLIDG